MIKKIIPKGESSRNVLTLMTGTSIAQAIPIAISPILTRIYTPNDFGVYALFISIAAIFGSIANARYEMAIMLPNKDEDALNIAALGVLISTILSCSLLVIVVLFNSSIVTLIGNNDIGFWLYFIPLSVWLLGLFNILKYFNSRKKNYKDIATANVYKSLAAATIQLSLGFLKPGATGLVSGQIISGVIANTKLLKNILLDTDIKNIIAIKKIKKLAYQYKDFPRFSLWATLSNTLSINLFNILISSYYSIATLGLYALVQRVLGMPTSILGSSIGEVFFQQASVEKRETGTVIKSFRSTFKKLLIISIIPFSILYVVAEDLFALVFGEEWRIAGVYASILIPLFAVKFIVSPLSLSNQVNLKNKTGMVFNIILLVITVTTVIVCNVFEASFIDMLYIFSSAQIVFYLFFLWVVYIGIVKDGRAYKL